MSTDDLLDEATRLAAEFNRQFPITANTLRALVERVQQGEREADKLHTLWEQSATPDLIAERDAARGKLDKVRTAVTSVTGEPHDDEISRDVLAILDE